MVTPDARFLALEAQPAPTPAAEALVRPVTRAGDLLLTSGQVPFVGTDLLATGVVGRDVTIEVAQACARQCAVNVLARVREELGSLDRVSGVRKLTVFIASAPGFRDQPSVADAATALVVEVLGERGRHARAAVGVAELPLGSPVEIEAIVTA